VVYQAQLQMQVCPPSQPFLVLSDHFLDANRVVLGHI
jgi:hypothetical protein